MNFSKIGLYVAVYPYDPKTMSPNTNSFDEELTFAQGQLIKVSSGYFTPRVTFQSHSPRKMVICTVI